MTLEKPALNLLRPCQLAARTETESNAPRRCQWLDGPVWLRLATGKRLGRDATMDATLSGRVDKTQVQLYSCRIESYAPYSHSFTFIRTAYVDMR